MKKLLPLFALAAVCLQSCAYKTYSHGSDYSMKIPKTFSVKSNEKENGKYEDMFYQTSNNTIPDYVVTMGKAPGITLTQNQLSDSTFTYSFGSRCNCTVVAAKSVEYGRQTYAEIDFNVAKNDVMMKGISMSTMHGSVLYTFAYVAKESLFEQHKPVFFKMISSLKLQ